MTIQLFKTKKDAEDECKYVKSIIHRSKVKPIKIKFDKRDGGQFGMRAFDFEEKEGGIYYIIADSKAEVKSWKLNSEIL